MSEVENKSIKLIIIEDSEDDTFLLLHTLKTHNYKIIYERIETADELNELLKKDTWDMVISDHTLPTFDSTQALSIVKDSKIDIPLIILSGNINPKIAVESMRNGAKDFIMKDDTSRLIPVIERELYEKELRKEKKILDAKIKFMAYHDSLTGLVNRAEFERRLSLTIHSAKENSSTHSLLFMDLDHFKIINDTCGHLAGDELLKQLSSKLLVKLRERDTLARMGGDEFCILLDNCPLNRALEIAHSISRDIRDFHFVWNEKKFKVGISIGVIIVNKDSGSRTSVLSNVDIACYSAKAKGRNAIEVYEEHREEVSKIRDDTNWMTCIDDAIENDNFILYQQLIKPLQNKEITAHHEILLRLNKDGEIILPDHFLPSAERYHKMSSIDFWVIDNSLKKLQSISMEDNKKYKIAINLSGHTLGDDSLYEYILDSMSKYSINPANICFEITETVAISNYKYAEEFFINIKKIGCKLSLDDFGSGFSSFTYLKNMPIDFVKIDGYFVKNIVNNKVDRAIVKSINDIAHTVGAKTIAEFVENEDIEKILKEMGVDYAQGFHIHKPQELISL